MDWPRKASKADFFFFGHDLGEFSALTRGWTQAPAVKAPGSNH